MSVFNAAMIPAKAVDPETGLLVHDEESWTNWEPLELGAGSGILRACEGYRYRIACYATEYDEALVHEYCYDAESNWTTLTSCTEPDVWLDGPSSFSHDCFVRITVQRVDGFLAVRPYKLDEMIELDYVPPTVSLQPAWAHAEAERVATRVAELREPSDLVLIALTDVHYSTGCIWPQTARNVRAVVDLVHPDAIVQLGDVGDGIAPILVTRSFADRVLGDLRSCGVPVLSCVGNHDVNYFKGNDELLSQEECMQLYLDREKPWYFEDFPAMRMRCVFLDSFDPSRKQRYGFAEREVWWLRKTLRTTPRDWKLLVFSHVPPLPEIHYWSDVIKNGPRVMRMLESRNRNCPQSVLAFVHGHSHVDQVYWKQSFPIVSIGCAKFEDFTENKPEGSTTYKRQLGTASQDLWDVIVVKANEGTLHFVRFGAGEDREVAPDGER